MLHWDNALFYDERDDGEPKSFFDRMAGAWSVFKTRIFHDDNSQLSIRSTHSDYSEMHVNPVAFGRFDRFDFWDKSPFWCEEVGKHRTRHQAFVQCASSVIWVDSLITSSNGRRYACGMFRFEPDVRAISARKGIVEDS